VLKPFEPAHVLARVQALLDRRTNGLLFDRIVKDLSVAIQAGGVDAETLGKLKEELTTFRVVLGSGPKVLLLDDEWSSAPDVREALEAAELLTVMDDEYGALRWVDQPGGPLVVLFDVARPGALELVRALRAADAQIEIMVTMHDDALDRALGAIAAGASDFVLLGADGGGLLGSRVRRLVSRGHRHRLYLHLVATLYRETRRLDEALAERIVSMATPEQQRYIRAAPRFSARDDETFDLCAVLGDDPSRDA
jgi:DNA-binding response OmpR family regulator